MIGHVIEELNSKPDHDQKPIIKLRIIVKEKNTIKKRLIIITFMLFIL
jgi:hypothetical protein